MFFIAVFHTANILTLFGVDASASASAVDGLQSLGMALYFLISGWNSRKYIDASWRSFASLRLWPMIYLFVVWTTITTASDYFIATTAPTAASLLLAVFSAYIFPTSSMWFLWSLILYHVLCRQLMRRYAIPVIVIALLVSIVCVTLDNGFFHRQHLYLVENAWTIRRVMSYPVFFFVGYRFPRLATRIAGLPLLPTLVAAAVVAWGLPVIAFAVHRTAAMMLLLYASLLAGLVVGIGVGRLLALLPLAGRFFRWVGRLTLPVYVMHGIMAYLLVRAILPVAGGPVHDHPVTATLTFALLSVTAALALTFALPSIGLAWLLRPPGLPIGRRTNADDPARTRA